MVIITNNEQSHFTTHYHYASIIGVIRRREKNESNLTNVMMTGHRTSITRTVSATTLMVQ